MNYERLSTEELQELIAADTRELNELEQAFGDITDRLSAVKAALANRSIES